MEFTLDYTHYDDLADYLAAVANEATVKFNVTDSPETGPAATLVF